MWHRSCGIKQEQWRTIHVQLNLKKLDFILVTQAAPACKQPPVAQQQKIHLRCTSCAQNTISKSS
jgi:hypothetical protein